MLTEETIMEAIKMYETGIPVSEIYDDLAILDEDDREEVSGMFSVINVMGQVQEDLENIKPSKTGLENVVDRFARKQKSGFLTRFYNSFIQHKAFVGTFISLTFCVMVGGLYWYSEKEVLIPFEKELLAELDAEIKNIDEFDAQSLAQEFDTFGEKITHIPISENKPLSSADELAAELDSLIGEFNSDNFVSYEEFDGRFDSFLNSF